MKRFSAMARRAMDVLAGRECYFVFSFNVDCDKKIAVSGVPAGAFAK